MKTINKLIKDNTAWVILLGLVIIFSILSDNFLSYNNIVNILTQYAYVIIAMYGVIFYMLSGAIDLSVGYQLSVIGILTGTLLTKTSVPVPLVILIAVLCGALMGLLNGALSIALKIPMMMVTLGTMTCYQGISYVISNSKTLSGFDPSFKVIGQYQLFGVLPLPIIILVVLFFAVSFILNRTYFGRYVYALGGNEDAAHLSGINVTQMRLIIAGIAGAFVGLASVILTARLGSANSSNGPGTEFNVITGILLGGVSMRGGEGKLSGALAGVLILSLISNGMQLAGFGMYAQYIVKGAIMLVAIGFDVFQVERANKAKVAKRRNA